MKKQDFVLIHSFPTNSIIFKGYIDFLNDYFNVHFIDLPGFNKKILPLEDITLENYLKYMNKRVKDLNRKQPPIKIGGITSMRRNR